MALLDWKDEYRTGIDSVDYEHEKLINLINELHEELLRHDSKDAIERTLGEIHAKISSHFALEEKIMRDMGYHDYDAHMREHNQLLDEIMEIMERFENDDSYRYSEALERELKHWFSDHFRLTDAKLHAYEQSRS